MAAKKNRKLFQVAKELKLSTATLTDELQELGYEVTKAQMTPINDDMYGKLLRKFAPERWADLKDAAAREESERLAAETKQVREKDLQKILAASPEGQSAPKASPSVRQLGPKDLITEPKKASEPAQNAERPTPSDAKADTAGKKAAQQPKKQRRPNKAQKADSADAPRKGARPARDDKKPSSAQAGRDQREKRGPRQDHGQRPDRPDRPKDSRPQRDSAKRDSAKRGSRSKSPAAKGDSKQSMGSRFVPIEQLEAQKRARGTSGSAPSVRGGVSNDDIVAFTPPPKPAEDDRRRDQRKSAPKPAHQAHGKTSTDQEDGDKKKRKRKRKTSRQATPGTETAAKPQSGGWVSTGDSGNKRRRKKKDKKRKQPDAAAVSATIRETMAAMDTGHKKKKKRRVQTQVGIADNTLNLLKITEFVSTQELADLMDVQVTELIKECLMLGLRVTINQRLERDTITLLAEEHEYKVEFVDEMEQQNLVAEETFNEEEETGELEPRAPIVTIMGHVDHGKTTLLDHIRKAHVAEGEAGGITQHIGAYEIEHQGNKITFLDTPGHEAFTAMRARGAQVTDVVVLVVAADDQVMPQTIEAIDHARAADVPVVVAINKVDKPGAKPERVRQQLSEHNVLLEEWGGDVQSSEISAKFGQGIDDLLDKIILATEILELKAVREASARGYVIESRQEKGRGTVCTVLIQRGTLHVSDVFVAGPHFGRVRAMYDERGQKRKEVFPGQPVQITGFEAPPHVGDQLVVFKEEREAKEIASKRQAQLREQEMRLREGATRGNLLKLVAGGEYSELNIIIKGDVDGSVEAIADSLMRLSTEEVKVKILHRNVGPINESDILLAGASGAMVIGFNVHPMGKAREMATLHGVHFETYRIIYELIEDVKNIIIGMHKAETKEEVTGAAEVRNTFKISRIGMIAGCYVTEGKIERSSRVRVLRDGKQAYNGELETLKRFKDDAKEVAQGYECGIKVANFNDIKVGDIIEAYKVVEVERNIEVGE